MRTIDELDELAEIVATRDRTYLRHSHGPERDAKGSSRDYESDLDLPGLSAVPLNPPGWWRRPVEDWLARQICKYAHLAERGGDRYPWVLCGRVADIGPDHEPLITDARPLARLSDTLLDEARSRYHERFEVGRDSLQ